jgi:ankyrin repeat protein
MLGLTVTILLVAAGWLFVDAIAHGNASSLHRAVMDNDTERALRLISRGADVNGRMYADLYPATWDATPLHIAARQNNVQIIDALVKAGADIDSTDREGFTPLHRAVVERADAAAQELARLGASVHAPVLQGRATYAVENMGQPVRTALEYAAVETVKVLVEHGADPRAEIGASAMSWARPPDLLAKLEFLFAQGCSVEGAGPGPFHPLHTAALSNDVPSIHFLLNHGANTEAIVDDETPLLAAARSGANDAIRVLIERGANPRAGTATCGSAIYAAAFAGKTETVRLLLSMRFGIDLQAGRASDHATPLHFAYRNQDIPMAAMLIDAGADANATTTDGRRPAEFRHWETAAGGTNIVPLTCGSSASQCGGRHFTDFRPSH